MIRLRRLNRDDSGVALILVLIAVVVVTVMGATLVIAGTRDLESSTSVQRATSALGVAEAAVQHGIQTLKTVGPSQLELSRLDCNNAQTNAVEPCYPDQSADGKGSWMNATDATQAPAEEDRFVGSVGTTDLYSVWIEAIQPISLTSSPPVRIGIYKIVAIGSDNRNDQVRPGTRRVEQNVRLRILDIPFALFAQDGMDLGGGPTTRTISLYSTGDIIWRNKISFDGTDLYYGGPTAAHATGTIYEGNTTGGGNNGRIHPPPYPGGYANCKYPHDRDKDGGPYPIYDPNSSTWSCSPATKPPYSSSLFTLEIMEALGINPAGPSEDAYDLMKRLAQTDGIYCTFDSSSSVIFQDKQSAQKGCNRGTNQITEKFWVLYAEPAPGFNKAINVSMKAQWGPQGDPNTTCDTGAYDGSFGIIVVRGGNLDYENNSNWWGAAFVPEGEFKATGNGSAWFVGTVYAKTMNIAGNFRVTLNDCWLNRSVGPFFTVTRLRWHESDRP
ncbi:MAG: hypothetical protein KY429_06715 [Actinobacteria bacterium]|nr:hypothetical protein [Actinomycetota bacterium]